MPHYAKLKACGAFAVCSFATMLLAGCGVSATGAAPSAEAVALTGRVHGGQQAVSGASITLFAAGSSGVGMGATNRLLQPVTTDANGNFGLTADYTCPSATAQMYIVARGGNPGFAVPTSNPGLVLVAALGDCGNLGPTSFIDIDEVTTVAAAWSLSRFTGSGALIGATPTNATGLRNAFAVASRLASTAYGVAPGTGLPAGAVVETAKINTLADALAPCVNSNGGAACTPLYTAATVAGVAPGNVFDTALNVVRNPGINIASVFNVVQANAPFQPTLARAPNDWTVSIAYAGGGIANPTALGVDGSGNVWIANYFGGVVSELSPTGVPAAANGFYDPALYESYGLTIDPSNNVWVTNEEGDPYNSYDGSLSKFSPSGQVLSGAGFAAGGLFYPYAAAADTDGVIWAADFGRSSATILNNDGTAYNNSTGFQSSALPLPIGVAVDAQHNAWFAAQGSAVRVTRAGLITQYSCCRTPAAVEVDPTGNVWITDYSASSLVELNSAGMVLQQLTAKGGLTYPEGLAIDGAGSVWVTAYRGNVIAGFGAASNGAASAVLSPAAGFGLDAGLSEPFGTAVDASGNLWVANFGNNTVVQFIGLTAPARTPVVGPPTAP